MEILINSEPLLHKKSQVGFDLLHQRRDHVGDEGVQEIGLFLVFLDHVVDSLFDRGQRELVLGDILLDVAFLEKIAKVGHIIEQLILFLDKKVVVVQFVLVVLHSLIIFLLRNVLIGKFLVLFF